ncbi:isopenicillin N synthase family dioxygenase [Algirhabdus cladophorae]|uniref:isopenicillin N synthase family dioxygenase n=1 Tax=Algirhabdus cladophorae TaxID=3377108 RepID=UPI003B84928D
MSDQTEVSVIDLRMSHNQVVADFSHAYSTSGFGYIIGHNIPGTVFAKVFEASKRFHALPMAQKMAVAVDANHRGYIPINTSTDVTSTLAKVTKPNQSASFMMMREDAVHDPSIYLSGPNQWPDLAGFRTALQSYNDAMTRLARHLLAIAFEAAGMTDPAAMQMFDTPTTWLRLLHYPPQPAQSADDLYGSAPHTDFGGLTLLAQDDVGGLQVQTPEGAWIDVPKIDGSLVVNVGDMLHRLSNGKLKSTPHRVINRSGRERYSCPFFFDPHVTAEIVPMTAEPAKFAPLTYGTFLRSQLEASYEAHQDATKA